MLTNVIPAELQCVALLIAGIPAAMFWWWLTGSVTEPDKTEEERKSGWTWIVVILAVMSLIMLAVPLGGG